MPVSNQAFSKRSQHVLVLTISQPSISDTLYTYNYSATMTSAGNTLRPYASGLQWRMDVVSSSGTVSPKGSGTYSYDFRTGNSLTATRTIASSGSFTINRPSSGSSNATFTLRFTANVALASAELIGRAISDQSVTVVSQVPPAPPPPAAPSWTSTASTTEGRVGTNFSRSYTATGINASNAYALASGNTLPASLTLNASSGLVSGTMAAGTTATLSFRINATGPGGTTLSPIFQISRIQPLPVWNTTSMDLTAIVGESFSTAATATGVNANSAYSVATGSLPPGISLNSTSGIISGSTVSAGSSTAFNFTLDATGPGGTTRSATFTINRRQPLPSWTGSGADNTLDTTNLRVGQLYSDSINAINATSYSISGLPARGLGFSSSSSSATISGTPNSTSSFTFTVTAFNADNFSVALTFTFQARSAFAVWVDESLAITSIAKGAPYIDEVSATGAVSYAVFSGALPPGILLNTSNGQIGASNQSATVVGSYTFVIRARNASNDDIFTGSLSITVTPAGSGSVWNGSAWVQAPFRVWNGSLWVEASAKVWNGNVWADPISN